MFKTYYEKVSDDYESHTSEDEEQGFDSSPKENSLSSSSLNNNNTTTIISTHTENSTEQKAVCSKACCSSSKACKEEEEIQPNNSSTTSSTMFVNHIKHTKGVKPKVMFGKKKIKISQLQHLNKHVNSEEEACSDDCEKPSCSTITTPSCKSNCCSSGSCTKEEPIIKTDCCSSGSCSKKAVIVTTPLTLVSEKKSCCTSGCCQSTSTAEIKVEELMKLDNLLPNQKSLHLNVRNLHCADCASMVEGVLTKKKGIISARVLHMTDTAQVVYDELVLQEAFIVKTIQELGFPTSISLLKNVSLSNSDQETLTTMFEFKQELQTHKIDELVQSVQKGDGILHAAFDNANQILQVVYNPDITGARDIKKMIESIDASHMFSIMSSGKANEITDTNNKNEIKVWRRNLIVSFILSIPVIFTAFIFPMIKPVDEFLKKEFLQGLNSYIIIGLIFSTPIQFYFGKPLYLSAYRALRYAKKPNMDTLVMLSTTTAYVYSLVSTVIAMCVESYKAEAFFETSALLLTFIILGRFLEILAKGQTSSILTSILKLRCTKAFLMFRGNYERITCQTDLVNSSTFVEEEEIDTELVQRGDILKCLPGSKIPTDGVVFYGTTSIDESMISGESIPVSKDVGDFVYGSTINQMGTIYIRVTKTSSENTLSSIDKLIHESQNAKVPIQRIADNVSAVFVPVIIGIAFLAFVIWISLCYAGVLETNLHPITFALQFSLAILVISCPCAISLAAPTAVMVGIAKGIEFGVLFKNGAVIEMCHKVNTVVFDKTGTLTNGKPVVTDVLLFEGDDLQQFKSIIGSAELGSEHVIGKAISTHVEKEGLPTEQPIDYQAVPGKGLKCSVFGKEVIAGNCTWMKDNSIAISEIQQEQIFNLENQGKTIVHVAIDGHLHGIVALSDTLKTESKLVVDELKKMNVEIWVVSGDNQVTTQYIANQLGIENVMANVLPANKREKVRELQAGKTSKGKTRVVSMIGDGINDSPSLAQADVGFAIGCGSDIALETADIILVKSDLRDVLVALDLSRTTFRRIKINFLWAFLYNAIGIPLSAGVFYPILGIAIPPAIAGLSEIFSSIPVILFSLLLKLYKPKVY